VLPGKKFTPDDVLRILWRRKWLIVLPFVVASLGTAVVASRLPARYRSDTLILITPQRVPDAYVRSTVSNPNDRETSMQERLAPIRQQVLSRARLERIIIDLNLYPQARTAASMEDLVERMRTRDIEIITPLRGGDSFQIAFTYENARLARDVVNKLAAEFIDASNQERTSFAESTTTFLGTQLDDARRRLEEVEKKLEAYKMRHAGELPTERDANLQVLGSLQMQVQQLVESINRDRDQRYLRERQLAELTAEPLPVAPPPPQAGSATMPPGEATGVTGRSATEDLASARAHLRLLQLRFTDSHWDVQRQKRVILDLEAKVQQEALQKPLSPEVTVPSTPLEVQRQNRIRDLRLEIEGIDRTIGTKQQEEKTLRGRISEYERRVEATPARESELTGLLRDYTTVQNQYTTLLAKQEDSKIAENLERRQVGERFKTVDQARLPERPISPNRPLIDLIGAIAGLGLGLGLAALLEYRDNSFRSDDEIVRLLSLPVVAVVPVMLTKAERHTRRRRTWMLSLAGGIFVACCLAATAWLVLKG